jgi:long-chain acyl-CoA synthetase
MLSSYILRMAEARDQTAFIEQGAYRARSYSYRHVTERARAFRQWLCSNGLGADNGREAPRVLLWASPGARWAMAFYGCVLAGAVVVPIDAGFSLEFLRRVAGHTRASLLITDRTMLDRLEPSESFAQNFYLEDLDALSPESGKNPSPAADRNSLLEVVYTSGTMATPRGVMITHGNLLSNLEPIEREIRRYARLSIPFRPLRFVHLIPLSHLFGQVMAIFIPQLLRGVVIFPETQAPARLAQIIHDRRASVMVCVPQQLEALGEWARAWIDTAGGEAPDAPLQKAQTEHWSIPRRWWCFRRLHSRLGWKMWAFVTGGATLPCQLERFWSTLGYAVIQGYGLTETAPAITISHPFKIRRGAVGRPIPGTETRIADDGEILVRGANVSPGYYADSKATEESLEGGWLHTGDLGRFDEQGNLIYLGRKKEVIVTPEGLNVYPEDVERVLLKQPAIQEAAVVGKTTGASTPPDGSPATSGRLLVHAVIVPAPGAIRDQLEVAINQANKELEPHQRIRGFSVWPQAALPRTLSTSKLQRTKVAAWVNAEACGTPPASLAAGKSDWKDFLVQLGAPRDRIRPETRLIEDLGLSSLDRVELLTWFETRGYLFDEEALARAETIGGVDRLVTPPAPAGAAESAPYGPRTLKKTARQRGAVTLPAPGRAVAGPPEPRWPISLPAAVGRELVQMLVAFPLLRYYIKTEVCGLEKLRALRGPALFICNHQSLFDVPVILRSLPACIRRRLAPDMGEAAIQGHSIAALFWTRLVFNTYLISDDPSRAQEALRHAGWLAEKGYSTLLFPEGERTLDGSLQPFRAGVGVFAERLQLPVLPLRVEGLFEAWPRTRERPVSGKAQLWIGELMRMRPGESAGQFAKRLEGYYRSWLPRVADSVIVRSP